MPRTGKLDCSGDLCVCCLVYSMLLFVQHMTSKLILGMLHIQTMLWLFLLLIYFIMYLWPAERDSEGQHFDTMVTSVCLLILSH